MAVIVLLAWLAGATSQQTAPVTVSAAVSLTAALEECARAYTASGGGAVRFNFAGSNVLARQIVNGAPADLFVSADQSQMDVAEKAGMIASGSRVDLLGNQLAIVASTEAAAVVRSRFREAPPEIRRLALADPAAVPAGVYARRYLEMAGLWRLYESRVVPTANVRAALAAVERGAAEAAIVYATDAAQSTRAVQVLVVPVDEAPRIVYPAAIVAASPRRAGAAAFLTFLQGPDAAAIFARHGFTPLAGR